VNKHPISTYMTKCPHCIEPTQSLKQAERRMKEYHVKHLPVRSAAKIVGILSERDLNFSLRFLDDESPVSEVMISDPYCTEAGTPISKVAGNMVEKDIGSAIITNEANEVVGIFTQVDALKAIVTLVSKL